MPIEYRSLREQARTVLRTRIITGQLAPGILYPIGPVAEELGVSATPVREALADLAHSGLVEVMRNRGFLVRELTGSDLDEILELRLMLEVPAVEELCGRIEPADESACMELIESCRMAANRGDLDAFLEFDRKFHRRILEVLHNGRLLQIVDQLRDETRLVGLPQLARTNQLTASSVDEHEQLLKALVVGDRNVGKLMAKHIRHARGIWAGQTESEA